MKYGVYSSVGIYPGLDWSIESVSNQLRDNTLFSVRTKMVADANLNVLDAVKAAVNEQLVATPEFRPTQWVLKYTLNDINLFLPASQVKLMTNLEINGVLKIAKEQLYIALFSSGANYFTSLSPLTPSPVWTTYVKLLTYIGKTTNDLIPDDQTNSLKVKASIALGMIGSKLYYMKKTINQIVDVPLPAADVSTYAISTADINDNSLTVDLQYIVLNLAK